MTKRQLIDEIVSINHTAKPVFLARFNEVDLDEYLQHLIGARTSRITGDYTRYKKYFTVQAVNSPAVLSGAATAESSEHEVLAQANYQPEQADEQAEPDHAAFDCDSDVTLAADSPAVSSGCDENQDSDNHAGVLVPAGNHILPAHNDGSECSLPQAKAQADGKWLF